MAQDAGRTGEYEGGEAIDLRAYFAVVRARKLSILGLAAVVVASAAFFSLRQTPQFTATARLLVKPLPNAQTATTGAPAPTINLQTEREVVASVPVAVRAREKVGLQKPADELLEDLEVESVTETEVLEISFTHTDPEIAAATANAFAEGYIDFRRSQALESLRAASADIEEEARRVRERLARTQRQIAQAQEAGDEDLAVSLQTQRDALVAQLGVIEARLQQVQPERSVRLGAGEVIEPARVPQEPSSPDLVRNLALATFMGLALGTGYAFLRERLEDRFRGRAEVEKALQIPVLATIPRYPSGSSRPLIVQSDPRAAVSESYRSLRTNLQFLLGQRNLKSVLFTSAGAGEGKTSTVANLAAAAAVAGKRVIVVSADMRRPTIERVLGGRNRAGLSTFLAGQDTNPWAVIQDTVVPNVVLLACGPVPPHPAELLTSPRLPQLIQELEDNSDLVLIDSPPVLAVTDAALLSSVAGATVLVVDPGQVHRSAAQRAKEELERTGAEVIGVVINAFDPSSAPYEYYYSYYPEARPAGEKPRGREARKPRLPLRK